MNLKRLNLKLEYIFTVTFFAILILILTLQIILRFFFNKSLAWTEEVSRYAFVWATYFGFILAAKYDKHIRVTAHFSKFPKKIQYVIMSIADTIWVVFNIMMVLISLKFTLTMLDFPYISQTTGINLFWIFLIIPLGFSLMTIYIIRASILRWINKDNILDSRLGV